jgi:hypothetical protein
MNIHDPVGELLYTEIKSGWRVWAAGIVGLSIRHSALKGFVRHSKPGVVMRHPEIEPTRNAKPTWKEIAIGIIGVLALAGLIAWNQGDGNNTKRSINQHTASEY